MKQCASMPAPPAGWFLYEGNDKKQVIDDYLRKAGTIAPSKCQDDKARRVLL